MMTLDRRTFLRSLAGAALAGAGLAPLGCRRAGPTGRRLERIGLQLYTVRGELADDFEGTLKRVAAVGYSEVEFAGYFDRTPEAVTQALQRTGLRAPAAHVPLPLLRENWDAALEAAQIMGHEYLVVAWIAPEERRSLDDYQRLAELFNRAGEGAHGVGIRFAYHNHDFEFVPLEGAIPYDTLLAETDPELVALELDLYWITKAGRDPLEYFDRYPGRVPLVHVKDSAGPPDHRMTDVGSGVIDFERIFARREQAGIQHFFVEHDQPADAFASMRASYEYLRELL